jgi:hypothetical protein
MEIDTKVPEEDTKICLGKETKKDGAEPRARFDKFCASSPLRRLEILPRVDYYLQLGLTSMLCVTNGTNLGENVPLFTNALWRELGQRIWA